MMFRPLLVAGLGLVALSGAGRCRAADLVVAAPAGPMAKVSEEAFVAPFVQASGMASVPLTVSGGDPPLPAKADVALLDGQTLLASCKTGKLLKLDWTALGGRERVLPQAAGECGVGVLVRSMALAWDRQKFSGSPGWAEFWDVARVPGKRGLQRSARGNLEFALIADGVALADVYGTLRDAAGVERAFRKLDQLKPYVVWWKTEEEAPRLLISGEVLMTSAPADGVLAAVRGGSSVSARDFGVQWAGALQMIESYSIVAGSPSTAVASRFLAFASDPKQQARIGPFAGFGGGSLGASDALGPAEKAQSASTPANLSPGLAADEAFWRDNGARLDKQFEAWILKP